MQSWDFLLPPSMVTQCILSWQSIMAQVAQGSEALLLLAPVPREKQCQEQRVSLYVSCEAFKNEH